MCGLLRILPLSYYLVKMMYDFFFFFFLHLIHYLSFQPFPGEHGSVIGTKIRDSGYHPRRPDNCPDCLWELLEECWALDPEQRPDFSNIAQRLGAMLQTMVVTSFVKPVETKEDVVFVEEENVQSQYEPLKKDEEEEDGQLVWKQ